MLMPIFDRYFHISFCLDPKLTADKALSIHSVFWLMGKFIESFAADVKSFLTYGVLPRRLISGEFYVPFVDTKCSLHLRLLVRPKTLEPFLWYSKWLYFGAWKKLETLCCSLLETICLQHAAKWQKNLQ